MASPAHFLTEAERAQMKRDTAATFATPDHAVIGETIDRLSAIFGAQDARRAERILGRTTERKVAA